MKKLVIKKVVSMLIVCAIMIGMCSVNTFASGFITTLDPSSTTGDEHFTTVGSSVTFTTNEYNAIYERVYLLTLSYSNTSGSTKTLGIYVNGQKVGNTSLISHSDSLEYRKSEQIYLNSGYNTIEYKYEAGSDSSINVYDLTMESSPSSTITLPQGGSVSASSQESWNPVANGIDGNTSTRWCAANGDLNQWYEFDFNGREYCITNTEIKWEADGKVYGYKIETSNDRNTWTTIVDATNNTRTSQVQRDISTAPNQTAKYVRLTVTGLETNWWASFYEFKLFGRFVQPY